MISDLFLWSDAILLCAFILLIQFAGIVRPLLSARLPLWKYVLVVFALAISLFSFVVAIHIDMFGLTFFSRIHGHLNLATYQHLQAQLSPAFASCTVQIYLLVMMIALLWGVKRTLKTHSVSAWVLAQDIRFRL